MPISIPLRQISAAGDNANTGSNSSCQPAFLGEGFWKTITHTLPIAADLTITRLVAGGVQMRGRYARLSALPQADLGPVCTENPIRID
jgi:hypothetical protein